MNQCIHGIDLLRWMMGNEVEEVYGVTKQQFHDYLECEDIGMAVVKFKTAPWVLSRAPPTSTPRIWRRLFTCSVRPAP